MANRKQRRSKGKSEAVIKEEQQIKNLILTIFILALIFGLMYLFTATILKKGLLSKGYTKPVVETPVIDYETSTIGTVFDKEENEYSVVFDEFSKNPNSYLATLLNLYNDDEDHLNVYKVDMSYGINDQYKSTKANKKVSKAEDLRINGITLMKIKKGKNVLYLNDLDKIANELGIELSE